MTVFHYDKDGLLHRIDGPAVDSENGFGVFYRHGKLHNTTGPAINYQHEYHWYVNDVKITSWEDFAYETGMSMKDVMIMAMKTDKPPK